MVTCRPPKPCDCGSNPYWVAKEILMCETLVCGLCTKKAKWIRVSQFSGKHTFCKEHAKEQEDYKGSDSSYFYWVKINRKTKENE